MKPHSSKPSDISSASSSSSTKFIYENVGRSAQLLADLLLPEFNMTDVGPVIYCTAQIKPLSNDTVQASAYLTKIYYSLPQNELIPFQSIVLKIIFAHSFQLAQTKPHSHDLIILNNNKIKLLQYLKMELIHRIRNNNETRDEYFLLIDFEICILQQLNLTIYNHLWNEAINPNNNVQTHIPMDNLYNEYIHCFNQYNNDAAPILDRINKPNADITKEEKHKTFIEMNQRIYMEINNQSLNGYFDIKPKIHLAVLNFFKSLSTAIENNTPAINELTKRLLESHLLDLPIRYHQVFYSEIIIQLYSKIYDLNTSVNICLADFNLPYKLTKTLNETLAVDLKKESKTHALGIELGLIHTLESQKKILAYCVTQNCLEGNPQTQYQHFIKIGPEYEHYKSNVLPVFSQTIQSLIEDKPLDTLSLTPSASNYITNRIANFIYFNYLIDATMGILHFKMGYISKSNTLMQQANANIQFLKDSSKHKTIIKRSINWCEHFYSEIFNALKNTITKNADCLVEDLVEKLRKDLKDSIDALPNKIKVFTENPHGVNKNKSVNFIPHHDLSVHALFKRILTNDIACINTALMEGNKAQLTNSVNQLKSAIEFMSTLPHNKTNPDPLMDEMSKQLTTFYTLSSQCLKTHRSKVTLMGPMKLSLEEEKELIGLLEKTNLKDNGSQTNNNAQINHNEKKNKKNKKKAKSKKDKNKHNNSDADTTNANNKVDDLEINPDGESDLTELLDPNESFEESKNNDISHETRDTTIVNDPIEQIFGTSAVAPITFAAPVPRSHPPGITPIQFAILLATQVYALPIINNHVMHRIELGLAEITKAPLDEYMQRMNELFGWANPQGMFLFLFNNILLHLLHPQPSDSANAIMLANRVRPLEDFYTDIINSPIYYNHQNTLALNSIALLLLPEAIVDNTDTAISNFINHFDTSNYTSRDLNLLKANLSILVDRYLQNVFEYDSNDFRIDNGRSVYRKIRI